MFREKGTKLTEGFKAAGKEHGFDLVVTGEPALFYLRIANDDSLMLHQEWVSECVSRGLFLASHHNHFMNAAVTDEDIKKSIEIAEDAFSVVEKNHPELKADFKHGFKAAVRGARPPVIQNFTFREENYGKSTFDQGGMARA